jgi:hypothetical protein
MTSGSGRVRLAAVAAGVVTLAALAVLGLLAARRNPLAAATRAVERADHYTFDGASGSQWASVVQEYEQAGGGRPFSQFTVTLGADGDQTLSVDWPDVAWDGEPVAARGIGPMLPAGDPLALVAAGHAARATRTDELGGRQCERVEFLTAGRAYVDWLRRHPGAMPVNADAGGLPKFSARGVLWRDRVTDLPCRIWAELELPRLAGEQPGRGWVDWEYEW